MDPFSYVVISLCSKLYSSLSSSSMARPVASFFVDKGFACSF